MISTSDIGFQAILDSFLCDNELPFSDVITVEEFAAAFPDDSNRSPDDDDDLIYTHGVTLWAFLSQMLHKKEQRTCQAAVERLTTWLEDRGCRTPGDHTGTYCRARHRLPLAGIRKLVRHIADACEAEVPQELLLNGRHVKVVDGTTSSMPDTEANQEDYPQHGAQEAGLGFPIVRYVVLISIVTGLVTDMKDGKYKGKETGETALFREILDRLSKGDILLADRYYCSWFMIALLGEHGVDIVFRQHQKRIVDFQRGQRLGKNDHLIDVPRPARPDWMDQEIYDALPENLVLRELKFSVAQKGFRTKSLVVVTTLLDETEYTKGAVATLYRQRWLVELDIRSIKVTLGVDVLSCRTPEMVRKELWVGLLAYNLIRRMILQAAHDSDRTPREVSFATALQKVTANSQTILLREVSQQQTTVRRVLESLVGHRIGNRPDRVEPRAIKRRPKPHKLLTEPRDVARSRLGPVPDGTTGCHSPGAIAEADREMERTLAAERSDRLMP